MTPSVVLLLGIVTGLIAMVIGQRKGHPVWGFFLGFLLSVVGIAVIALTKPTRESQTRRAMERMRAEEEARRRLGPDKGPRPQ